MTIILCKPFHRHGQQFEPGETVELPERLACVMVGDGRALELNPKSEIRNPKLESPDPEPVPAATAVDPPEATETKRSRRKKNAG